MKTINLFKNRDDRRVLCWPNMLLFLVLALTLPALSGWAISWLLFGDAIYARSEQVIICGVCLGITMFACTFWKWRRLPIEHLPRG
jgi:uncharacterized membrane protein (DUF485 family)